MHIEDLLRIAVERKASDLHLKAGNYPHVRVYGELVPLTDQACVSAEDMLNMAFSMMSNRQAYRVAGLGRSQGLVGYETPLDNASNPDDFKLKVQGIHSTADAAREQMEQTGFGVGRS